MWDFTNKRFEGIEYSRIVASWNNATIGKFKYHYKEREAFREWLKILKINDKNLPDDVIRDIWDMKYNGKLEVETHVEKFISTLQ